MKMKQSKKGNWKLVKMFALFAMLAAWVSVPLLTDSVKADGTPLILVRTAALAAPSGAVNPHGAATWELYQSGNREIEVEVEDLSLPQGTVLTAFVDGTSIGQLTVDDSQKARLKLKTEDGQSVPTVNNGSTVQVRNGPTVLAVRFADRQPISVAIGYAKCWRSFCGPHRPDPQRRFAKRFRILRVAQQPHRARGSRTTGQPCYRHVAQRYCQWKLCRLDIRPERRRGPFAASKRQRPDRSGRNCRLDDSGAKWISYDPKRHIWLNF
jgi:hypothetical protein